MEAWPGKVEYCFTFVYFFFMVYGHKQEFIVGLSYTILFCYLTLFYMVILFYDKLPFYYNGKLLSPKDPSRP